MRILKSWNKLNFKAKLLVSMAIYLAIFTQECLYIFFQNSCEPSTLIISAFAAFGIEGGFCAILEKSNIYDWIKLKVKNENKNIETKTEQF